MPPVFQIRKLQWLRLCVGHRGSFCSVDRTQHPQPAAYGCGLWICDKSLKGHLMGKMSLQQMMLKPLETHI